MSDLFLRASREAWRFPSFVGDITTEQLWQLPLIGRGNQPLDLNGIAKSLHILVKSLGEESFVQSSPNPAKDLTEAKLELVKFVIATKQEEDAKARARAAKAARRAELMAALTKRDKEELDQLPREAILKELNDLDTE